MNLTEIVSKLLDNQVVGTVVLILVAIAIRLLAERFLAKRSNVEAEQRRRTISNLRNSLFFIVLIGLMFIWAPALRTFALSLTAFAVAIILATKEIILCISGSLVKAASRSMRVGNWIEINGMRGEVVDQSLLSTTIQELGNGTGHYDFTGRTIILPNSIFLSSPIVNERFFKRYVIHSFHLMTDPLDDVETIERSMIDAVVEEMEEHIENATRYNALIEKQAGIDIVDLDPRSTLSITSDGKTKITITAFLPTLHAVPIEQKAVRAGLSELRKQRIAQAQEYASPLPQ